MQKLRVVSIRRLQETVDGAGKGVLIVERNDRFPLDVQRHFESHSALVNVGAFGPILLLCTIREDILLSTLRMGAHFSSACETFFLHL